MNKRVLGAKMETKACDYLKAQGFRVMERNFRNRQGEIDIIGYHQQYLVFVEVKYRSTQQMGTALAAVDIRKQRQICKVADYYRYIHHMGDDTMVRYDVLAIQGEDMEWVQNAFPHRYTRTY